MSENTEQMSYFFEFFITNSYYILLAILFLVTVFSLLYYLTPVRGKIQKKTIIFIDIIWVSASLFSIFYYIQDYNIRTAQEKIDAVKEKLHTEQMFLKYTIDYNANIYLEKIIKEKLPSIKVESTSNSKDIFIEIIINGIKKEIEKNAEISCSANPSIRPYEILISMRKLLEENGTITEGDLQEIFQGHRTDSTTHVGFMIGTNEISDYTLVQKTIDKAYSYIDHKKEFEDYIKKINIKKDYAEKAESNKLIFILIISFLISLRLMKNIIEFDLEKLKDKEMKKDAATI